jgi:hypothetical protein
MARVGAASPIAIPKIHKTRSHTRSLVQAADGEFSNSHSSWFDHNDAALTQGVFQAY